MFNPQTTKWIEEARESAENHGIYAYHLAKAYEVAEAQDQDDIRKILIRLKVAEGKGQRNLTIFDFSENGIGV